MIFRIPYSEGAVGDLESWLNLEDSPIRYRSGFNLNGIAAIADGHYLLTVQYNTGDLFRIDLNDQTIVPVEMTGGSLRTGDGLWLEDDTLYVVRNSPGEVAALVLSDDYTRASAQEPIRDDRFNSPTTLAVANNRLLVVNFQRDAMLPGSPFTIVSVPLASSAPD